MAVLAAFIVDGYMGYDGTSGKADLSISGQSADGSVDFRTNSSNGPMTIYNVDLSSYHLNRDIEDAVKTKLQQSPYNMTFGSGDTVRMIPA